MLAVNNKENLSSDEALADIESGLSLHQETDEASPTELVPQVGHHDTSANESRLVIQNTLSYRARSTALACFGVFAPCIGTPVLSGVIGSAMLHASGHNNYNFNEVITSAAVGGACLGLLVFILRNMPVTSAAHLDQCISNVVTSNNAFFNIFVGLILVSSAVSALGAVVLELDQESVKQAAIATLAGAPLIVPVAMGVTTIGCVMHMLSP